MTAIKKLIDGNGNQYFPQTHTKAVVDDNGYSVESRMQAVQDVVNQAQMQIGSVPNDLSPTEGSTNWVTSGGVYNAINAHNPVSNITELDATYTQGYHWSSSMVLTQLSTGSALAMEIDVSDCIGRVFTYTGTRAISTSTSGNLRNGVVMADDTFTLLTASALQSYTIPSGAKYLRISFNTRNITDIAFTIPHTSSPASEEMVLAKSKIRKTLTQEDVEMTSDGYYNASGEFVSSSGYVSFMHDITGYEGGVYDCSSMTMASGYLGFVLTDDSVVAYKTAVDKLRVPDNAKYVFGGWYSTSAANRTFSVTSYYGLEDIAGKSDLDKLAMSLSDGTVGIHDKYDLNSLAGNIHIGYYWSVSGQDIVRTTASDILAFKMNVENYRGWVLHYKGIQTTTNGGNSFVTGSGDVTIPKIGKSITIPSDATVLGLTLRASVDYDIYLLDSEESAIMSENALQRAVDTLNSRISSIETSTGTLPSNTVWYVLGDSNSASGLYASHKYYNYIAAKNNIESNLHVLAGDGNAWGVNGNYGTIYSQAQRIGQDATLITIWAGSNDFNHAQTEIGTWPAGENGYAPSIPSTFAECSTFYEYVLFDLNYIQAQFPSATIALIIPLGKTNTTTVGGETYTMDKFSRVIKECAEYYGLPVIPLGWEVGFGGAKKRDLYVDQAHLNNKGQRKAAAFIESHLRMILNEVPEIE